MNSFQSPLHTATDMATAPGIRDVVPNVHRSGFDLVIKFRDTEVSNGMVLPPGVAKEEPFCDLRPHHQMAKTPNRLFCVVVCFDPDAPSPEAPVNRSFLHWLVANIPPYEHATAVQQGTTLPHLGKGDVLCDWMGPAPPQGTHRYIFLVYEQSPVPAEGTPSAQKPTHGQHTLPKDTLNNKRAKWDPQAFAKQHGLGEPIAALYFLSQAPNEPASSA